MKFNGIVFVVVILMLCGCRDAKLPEAAEYGKYLKWLQGLGGHLFGCSIRPIPGAGMGVVADRDMQEGTMVMKIPFKAMILDEPTLVPRDFSSALKDDFLSGALFIANEKKKGNSFWKPWLDILPDDVGLILNFSDDELKELEGSLVASYVKAAQHSLSTEIDKLIEDLNKNKLFPEITREDILWGISVWKSRTFNVSIEEHDSSHPDQKKVVALVPLADMLNDAVVKGDGNAGCRYSQCSHEFICALTKNVTAGEELLDEYSYDPTNRHNTKLLSSYGFAVRNNPHDCVYLKVPPVKPILPLYPWRTTLAKELPINKDSLYCMNRTNGDNPNISQLIRLTRLLAARSQEIKKSTEVEHPFSKPLSVNSEKKALGFTIAWLELALQSYPTTIHEDEAILEQKDLSANVRNAVLLRHGEKSVLLENIDYIHKKLEALGF